MFCRNCLVFGGCCSCTFLLVVLMTKKRKTGIIGTFYNLVPILILVVIVITIIVIAVKSVFIQHHHPFFTYPCRSRTYELLLLLFVLCDIRDFHKRIRFLSENLLCKFLHDLYRSNLPNQKLSEVKWHGAPVTGFFFIL